MTSPSLLPGIVGLLSIRSGLRFFFMLTFLKKLNLCYFSLGRDWMAILALIPAPTPKQGQS